MSEDKLGRVEFQFQEDGKIDSEPSTRYVVMASDGSFKAPSGGYWGRADLSNAKTYTKIGTARSCANTYNSIGAVIVECEIKLKGIIE